MGRGRRMGFYKNSVQLTISQLHKLLHVVQKHKQPGHSISNNDGYAPKERKKKS
jgi:hypothetical protein